MGTLIFKLRCQIFGSDIDIRVLKGYGVGYTKPTEKLQNKQKCKKVIGHNVFTNFINYGLTIPQIIRNDINQSSIQPSEFFDSIVSDPPYGKRAFQRSIGEVDLHRKGREERVKRRDERRKKEKEEVAKNNSNFEGKKEIINIDEDSESEENEYEDEINTKKEELAEEKNIAKTKEEYDHSTIYPSQQKITYTPLKRVANEQIFESLLNLSDKCLVKGGMLVFLYPSDKE